MATFLTPDLLQQQAAVDSFLSRFRSFNDPGALDAWNDLAKIGATNLFGFQPVPAGTDADGNITSYAAQSTKEAGAANGGQFNLDPSGAFPGTGSNTAASFNWTPPPDDSNSNLLKDTVTNPAFLMLAGAGAGQAIGEAAGAAGFSGAYGSGAAGASPLAASAAQSGVNGLQYVAGPAAGAGSVTSTVTSLGGNVGVGADGVDYGQIFDGSGTNAAAGSGNFGPYTYQALGAAGAGALQSGANALGGALPYLAAGQLASGLIGANSAKTAGDQQLAAAQAAAATNQNIFNTLNAQGAPYRQTGYNALNEINTLTPQFEHQFNASDLNANLAPNYQFQLDQGIRATQNAGNMQTGLLSGNTIKGVNDYAQNYAGNAYQNAFNNYNTNQTNIYNRLAGIAGLGQTANGQSVNAGGTAGTNIGNAQIAGGQAQASGTVGATNAITGGLTNAASWYALPDILKLGATG